MHQYLEYPHRARMTYASLLLILATRLLMRTMGIPCYSSWSTCSNSYIRHLSYCFYIAVNRICAAISRVDGALKPWSAIHIVGILLKWMYSNTTMAIFGYLQIQEFSFGVIRHLQSWVS